MAIQIGKYKRPGIFIEEFDNSVITSPTVTGISTLVIGFSKKGPVNTPVLLQNVNDLQNIFGTIDNNMERKGSYFHRTVAKMLESSPVYAMNLLVTSDIYDQVQYKSLSTATNKSNDVERTGPYRKFFDTTGFWKRSTDSFITLTSNDPNNDDRLLAFTNLSDKYATVFIYKSQLSGFDVTMLQWYGSADQVPSYINSLDYASDYMVDVVVVAGDWSNYQQLSVDSKWSAYFNSEGLQKNQVSNFINDRNVNLLKYYEGLSLIPYFRDANGNNIFIETNINQDTDTTGIFCYFDADKFEKNYPVGMIDLIGNNLLQDNNLIDNFQKTINFLSYQATVVENVNFENVPLDVAGGTNGQNVIALGASVSLMRNDEYGTVHRTSYYSEKFINGVNFDNISGNTQSISITYDVSDATIGTATASAYTVIGANVVNVTPYGSPTFSILSNNYPNTNATASYTSVIYIDSSNGVITKKDGVAPGSYPTNAPTLALNDVPLGYVMFSMYQGQIATQSFVNVYSNSTGYNELLNTSDYTVVDNGSGSITVTFIGTALTDSYNNYEAHRKISLFNTLVSYLDSARLSEMTMISNLVTKEKLSLSGASITSVTTDTTSNKSFTLNLGVSNTPSDIAAGNLIFYKTDNEFTLGQYGFNTRTTCGTAGYGVVGQYSDFYTDFYNGEINTGDFFYRNIMNMSTSPRVVLQNSAGNGYIVFSTFPWASGLSWGYSFVGDEQIVLPDSTLNTGVLSLYDSSDYHAQLADPVTGLTYSGAYVAYKLTTQVTAEVISSISTILDVKAGGVYLQTYLDTSGNLEVKLTDSSLSTQEEIDITNDATISVYSDKSNYKQTIEIETPTGYTQVSNKILVVGSRYTEVVIGDFLEAAVLTGLPSDEVQRRLTRILSKRTYAADTTLVEITCDSSINKVAVGTTGKLQTMRYSTIDDYVSTYQAITLSGFTVRTDSMPDGTETKQNAILNLVANGTSLFKAITNKEAIDFRYVIDSFGLGLTEMSKQQLVDICGTRLDCLGFINMPSMKSFKNSSSPTFVDSNGVLQTSLIAQGGDLTSSPAFLYSFGNGSGVSSVGYFLPYVIVNDNGRPTDVPPAMFAATTYMRKQNSNATNITPWTIAAGITNGRILNIAGLEMDFNPDDIDNLNQAQMNPIVYKRNRGFVIETENTAQTLYKSSLSYLHVREVLIELERELSSMLLDFQWKFNTADVRAEIKLRADTICDKYVNKNGLYNYFNKCDEENNTPTVIDNQIGVLDTYVEPIKGMGVIVNNVTILRTGAISSGGFING